MRAHVLTGSKEAIAEQVARLPGDVREAIVFVDEPADHSTREPGAAPDIFIEMEPHMVSVGGADYSREAIYRVDPE